MTSNLKRRNDKRQPRLGADNKQSISIVVNFRIRARKYHGSPITLLRRYREWHLKRDTSIIKEHVIPDEPERAIRNPFCREHP
ncbi:hypothetical protein AB3A96_002094 [Vibrio vulnificus]